MTPFQFFFLSGENRVCTTTDTLLNKHDLQYHTMVDYVLKNGTFKSDRTGTGTRSVFGYQMRFNLRDGTVPLLTSKKMFVRAIIHELLWYIAGGTNNNDLRKNNVTIWDEWARTDGDLGPVYGFQWRNWRTGKHVPRVDKDGHTWHLEETIDQLAILIDKLKNNPNDRRLIVSAWNVADLPDMALPPCHYLFQCYTRPVVVDGTETRELSMILNQRSADIGLGVPFNIIQYSLLLRMLAEVCGYVPGEFIWNGGDVHIYNNHVDQLQLQLTRSSFEAPKFRFARPVASIDDFGYDDFVIEGYQSHPTIKMDVAI